MVARIKARLFLEKWKAASSVTHGPHQSLLEGSDSLYAWQWYFREIGVKLLVSKSVYHLFDRNRQFGKKHECGGLLFVHNNHRDGVVLCLATPPNSKDKSTRYSLDFDHERCRIETKEANEKNLRLIGYWHSHPEDIPNLSAQDMQSFRQLIKDNQHELPSPFAIIVGRNQGPEGIRAWLIRGSTKYQAEFQPINKE